MKMRSHRNGFFIVAAAVLLAWVLPAADQEQVQIPVTVTDPLNRFVTGLEAENFRVFEDKSEQKLVQFSNEDAPLAIGIVFDCSGSMGSKLEKSREAVAQFF